MTDLQSEAAVIVQLSLGEYAGLRNAYRGDIEGQMLEFMNTDGAKAAKYKNAFKRAITETFPDAFYMGYADAGGGGREDVARADDDWLTAKMNAEYGHVDMLFNQLLSLRKDEETGPADYQAEAARRAEGYTKTLDGVYNEGRLRGGKDVMAEFGGDDGEESCPECQKYKGVRHKLSWWIKRNLIPGQPGNASYTCHGYNCRHYLFNAKTGDLLTF